MPYKDKQKALAANRASYRRTIVARKQYYHDVKDHKNEVRRGRQYGMAVGEYEAMLVAQGHRCGICGDPFVGVGTKGTAPVIDHCHTTNKVRGILHNNCNRGIGFLLDNPVLCDSAAYYLRHNG